MYNERKNLIHLFESSLLPCIALIPLFKILTLIFKVNFPLQYAPVALFTAACLLVEIKQWRKIFLLNAVLAGFCLLSFGFSHFKLEVSILKNQIAAFVYANSFLAIYFVYLKNQLNQKLVTYAKTLFWATLVLIFLCYLSVFFAFYKTNQTFSFEELMGLIFFSRSDVSVRSFFIQHINPVGFLTQDFANMKMIGPQLLINPFILFVLCNVKENLLSKRLFLLLMILSFPVVLALNSRASVITLIVLFGLLVVKKIPAFLNAAFIILVSLVPLIVVNLPSKLLNGRECQINFVKERISYFGNGIGSGQTELNSVCGKPLNIQFYQAIESITYDNIHIEAVHYFGVVFYLLILAFLVYRAAKSNFYQTRVFFALLFIFFTLNLNLFEIYFVPLIAYLFMIYIKPGESKLQ